MRREVRSFFFFLAGLLALPVSGCGTDPIFDNVVDATRYIASRPPETGIDRAVIAKLPYATIAAKVGKQPQTVLVLKHIQNDNRHWVSSDGGVLVTRKGRLVQTAGFTDNLRAVTLQAPDPVPVMHRLAETPSNTAAPPDATDGARRLVDVEWDGVYRTLPLVATVEVMGRRRIEIAGIEFDTILVRERNRAESLNWTFDNYFWIDPYDGFVWKSRQHFARGLPPVEIEVLKPAG